MRRIIFIISFLVIYCHSFSQTITVDALRREYPSINKDSASCAKLYKKILKVTIPDNTTDAYKGAITIVMAGFVKGKELKLSLFLNGKKMLEKSIASDTSDIELRFLRFTVQTNCPKILGYNKKINSDKNFILKHYSSVTNPAIKNLFHSFLLQTSFFTEAEKQKIKN